MPRYKIKTTVDITRTNPDRDDPDQVRHAQQSNFNTLVQGIGMRSNIDWDNDPIRIKNDDAVYWEWEFLTERPDVFLHENDPVGLLLNDLHGIPVIRNLTNSDPLDPAIFQTHGDKKNIWFNTAVL